MNKLNLFIYLILCTFTPLFGKAQVMKISGTVYDTTGIQPVSNAIVMAVRLKDSVLLGFTRTNEKGEFNLKKIHLDTFNLIISDNRFEDRSYFVFGSSENQEISIPKIRFSVKSKEIEEVVIFANRNPIYFRGDTMVYLADSFKVGENAVVEDLLKRLPGIKIDKDGKIKSQGKEISQVLVDGDEFFGSDPSVATKNLGAKGVETIEVYEKKTENTNTGEEETIQVMNLTLKGEAKKGYFGRISASTDFKQFYEGELLLNSFNKSQKISVFALGSNTPRSGFDWGDINKFGLDNEGGGYMNEDGEYIMSGNSNNGNGIPKTFRSGIYYNDKIGKNKKTKVGFNYTYNNYQLNSLSKSRSQYFLADTSYYSDDSSRTIIENESHTINFSLFSQIDSLTSIEFKPKIIETNGTNDEIDYSSFLTEKEELSRISLIKNRTASKSTEIDNKLNFVHKFMKPRRQIKANYELNYVDNANQGSLNYQNNYYLTSTMNDTTNQSKINDNSSQTHIGKVTYTEPLTKKIKLEVEYMYEYGLKNQRKETRDFINGTYSDINTNYSNSFENVRKLNRASTSLIYESKKHTASIGTRVRNIQINNENIITKSIINQNITNLLPKASYSYSPNQTTHFRFNYKTDSRQPSISNLQPIPDNTNPNSISTGNPNLKPLYMHSADVFFNTWNALSGKYIWTGGNVQYTNNDFADSSFFDNYGRQVSKTVNIDGNFWSNVYFGCGIPIYKKLIEITPGFNGSYSRYSNYINGEKNTTSTSYFAPNFGIQMTLDSLSISFNGDVSFNNPKSSISSFSNKPYTMQQYTFTVNWTLPWWHLKINSDVFYTINGQRANGYNLKYFIWNANINKAFLKTENLILSLQANDILNQNISANRDINSNIITDYKTKIISRYFLVKLTLKFNNNKTKEEDFDDWN